MVHLSPRGSISLNQIQDLFFKWVFPVVIDRESVSPSIVRAICKVCKKIYSATNVTDEQNSFSQSLAEGPRNLFVVRIRCVSVMCTHPHMYPRGSTSLDTYSDMYVKDEVLLYTMKCKP